MSRNTFRGGGRGEKHKLSLKCVRVKKILFGAGEGVKSTSYHLSVSE